jgi:3-hydroxyisobutyrate dehydrogenase-like beta-hydroxyacid dehydrogenase
MGSGLGWALAAGGHDVITSLSGRSARTARLAADAGLRNVPGLADVLAQADVVLVVTPPAEALTVAADIVASIASVRDAAQTPGAPTGGPIVVDLNATAPATARAVGAVLAEADLDFVDGSISGAPPTVRPGATIYLSGPRAQAIASLNWTHANPVVVGAEPGAASAVKMSTASVYKGLSGLITQALRSASHYGVLEAVMADLGEEYATAYGIAVAATKADRFVGEMHEIARTQADAGLTPRLFDAFAEVWSDIASTQLAADDPEGVNPAITVDEVTERLRRHRLAGA